MRSAPLREWHRLDRNRAAGAPQRIYFPDHTDPTHLTLARYVLREDTPTPDMVRMQPHPAKLPAARTSCSCGSVGAPRQQYEVVKTAVSADGLEPPQHDPKSCVLPLDDAESVPENGFEPLISGPEPDVLPLDYSGSKDLHARAFAPVAGRVTALWTRVRTPVDTDRRPV